MIRFDAERIAREAGARVTREGAAGHPERAGVDSRRTQAGDLFFGLPGERANGGEFASQAMEAGAWGAVVGPEADTPAGDGWVFVAEQPLEALQRLARAWRREIGCDVVGITGSTGKTSVKDICRAMLPGRVHASPENYNTEIGLPLAVLAAPEDTETMVLEMAMRGRGQIRELSEIAEPDVAAITNIGPVHLELLGTLDAIIEAKAEILSGLSAGGRAVIPADAEALTPHLRDTVSTLSFGPGGDVLVVESEVRAGVTSAVIDTPAGQQHFLFPFTEAHNLQNALCAVAIGVALSSPIEALVEQAPGIVFSPLRGEQIELADDVVVINDCYNANPLSMRAALDHLGSLELGGRRVAVLGGMGELGPDGPAFHREVGGHARELGIDVVIGVGELGRDYEADAWVASPEEAVDVAEPLIGPGDAVLVKGSRSVGLERFTEGFALRRGRKAS